MFTDGYRVHVGHECAAAPLSDIVTAAQANESFAIGRNRLEQRFGFSHDACFHRNCEAHDE
jgi:hypothetical protein